MAAAVAAPLAAGGEEAAAAAANISVPGSAALPGSRSAERALEEAVATGTLNLSNRRLKHFPRGAARSYDLSDITQADLSRNRFPEVPEAACQLVSLEGLSLYHNCLRCLNPSLGNLTALTYLNLSRNQLSSLPPYICQLPLRVLIVSNNKLGALPPEVGALGSLRQLDVSSNELQSLPVELCSLPSLRDLNVRRNQLTSLPDELGDLPLVRLDFSCNRVSRIPVSFCRLRHLQVILLDSNPLQSPPAQICLKGKLHIFKYLSTEAGRRVATLGDLAPSRPPSFSPCPAEDLFPGRRYDGGLDSGFHSVDSGSKRWSGNESTDEFSELSFRISELAREPRGPRERREDGSALAPLADADQEQTDFIDSHVPGEDEERASAEAGGAGWGGAEAPRHLAAVAGTGAEATAAAERVVGGLSEGQFPQVRDQGCRGSCCYLIHAGHLQWPTQVHCHPAWSSRGAGSPGPCPSLPGTPSCSWTSDGTCSPAAWLPPETKQLPLPFLLPEWLRPLLTRLYLEASANLPGPR
ncbi:leucine-rich repeat and calponin homology domain-containing protein 4 isoform X15 [Ochotona princeps]|uniref:leucine-rich repeat and calponin homology domain-containing protein 4 isoform X15 n=1 Tax=Ochotona princeps TaxID=9978 RepID=UPI002714D4E7|nr:leucine-rich repeat and calponin homology domain-containing protein 4 isoform X15 [Ochotona princeps]